MGGNELIIKPTFDVNIVHECDKNYVNLSCGYTFFEVFVGLMFRMSQKGRPGNTVKVKVKQCERINK